MKRLLNRQPSRPVAILLGLLPFLLAAVVYAAASTARLAENPNDKLLPSLVQMFEAVERLALEPNRRTGEVLLWVDTAASLTRLGIGVAISAFFGLLVGVLNGLIPYGGRTFSPFVAVASMVPPLAILPILFIVFGVGELAKVMLIIFGVAPFIMRDVQQRVEQLPAEQLIKAQSLGASTWQVALRVVLPQVLPRLLDAVRLSLGAAWLFLIAAEAIAAQEGLGYRIFLVRRYLDMETILPYVAWITLLAFSIDLALRLITRTAFPWYQGGRSA